MAKSNRTPNEQRSDIKNDNNADYQTAMDNRSVQINKNKNK